MKDTPNTKRCAIYTRKSCEDGLELEYNSLDAQYDASASYIRSQVANGWEIIPKRYDDGGFSGELTDASVAKYQSIALLPRHEQHQAVGIE